LSFALLAIVTLSLACHAYFRVVEGRHYQFSFACGSQKLGNYQFSFACGSQKLGNYQLRKPRFRKPRFAAIAPIRRVVRLSL
jgi:hypothetical protein